MYIEKFVLIVFIGLELVPVRAEIRNGSSFEDVVPLCRTNYRPESVQRGFDHEDRLEDYSAQRSGNIVKEGTSGKRNSISRHNLVLSKSKKPRWYGSQTYVNDDRGDVIGNAPKPLQHGRSTGNVVPDSFIKVNSVMEPMAKSLNVVDTDGEITVSKTSIPLNEEWSSKSGRKRGKFWKKAKKMLKGKVKPLLQLLLNRRLEETRSNSEDLKEQVAVRRKDSHVEGKSGLQDVQDSGERVELTNEESEQVSSSQKREDSSVDEAGKVWWVSDPSFNPIIGWLSGFDFGMNGKPRPLMDGYQPTSFRPKFNSDLVEYSSDEPSVSKERAINDFVPHHTLRAQTGHSR